MGTAKLKRTLGGRHQFNRARSHLLLGPPAFPPSICSVVWLFGYELWIVPNLWSDTISIMDAFKPLYTFDKSEGGNVRALAAVRRAGG